MSKKNKKVELVAKKVGMTQVFDATGNLLPVTVLEVSQTTIVQLKATANEGYESIQAAYGEQKKHRVSKALQGHFAKGGLKEPARGSFEIRVENSADYSVGEKFTVAAFVKGQMVDVTGTTKGQGFQGVVKRWGFGGGPASHGSMSHRRGGSFGNRQDPGEIYKQKKMPGRMMPETKTVQNLEVVAVFEDKGVILIKGSVPGYNGSMVRLRSAKKAKVQA